MEPQDVALTVMDSARTPVPGTVQVERLSPGRRVSRGLLRWAIVTGVGAVVALLPLLHLCGAVLVLLAAPVAGVLAFRVQVLLGEGPLPCPKCGAVVPVAGKTPGWPAKLHCGACGSTLIVRPAG